jgi:ribonuclease HI
MSPLRLLIYTDGASRNNPGESAIGVVIKNDQQEVIETLSEYLGQATNNQAEYTALIRALESAQKFSPQEVQFYLDSQLVVRQMMGQYRVKDSGLMPLFMKARSLYHRYPKASIHHIPREQNGEADALANAALDKRLKETSKKSGF